MFFKDVDTAVDCLRPLLKRLRIREDFADERTVRLIEVPELDFLNLNNWTVVLIRENLPNSGLCGRLVTRHRKQHNLFQYIIYLNEPLFFNTESAKMKRRIVAIHEFIHFAACIYAYSSDKTQFVNSLECRFNETIDEIYHPDVSSLYHLMREKKPKESLDVDTFRYNQHSHFSLGTEKIGLSYTDLYLNLYFSRGAFEEYFDLDKQKEFYRLWQSDEREKAIDLYCSLVKDAARGKWVPEQFALDQADEWLLKYIQKPI